MSTRANFLIITEHYKAKFQSNSSAYPDNMMESMFKFVAGTASRNAIFDGKIGFYEPESFGLSELIEECGLSLGWVGNPSYYYTFDFVKKTLEVLGYKLRWIKAPADWQERGWNCYQDYNGKHEGYGWHSNVKGKKLLSLSFNDMITDVIDNVGLINIEKLNKSKAI